MSRPTKAPNGATVGRDNFKKKKKRPSVDNTKTRPFDYDEYVRMEYWNKAQARKIRQRNPVKNKSIGGRRKAITAYLDTKVNKLKTLALLRRIRQVKNHRKNTKNVALKYQVRRHGLYGDHTPVLKVKTTTKYSNE